MFTSSSANISSYSLYADVARTPPNRMPLNLNSILFMKITPLIMTDTLYCIINTFRVVNEDTEKISADAIRMTVKKKI